MDHSPEWFVFGILAKTIDDSSYMIELEAHKHNRSAPHARSLSCIRMVSAIVDSFIAKISTIIESDPGLFGTGEPVVSVEPLVLKDLHMCSFVYNNSIILDPLFGEKLVEVSDQIVIDFGKMLLTQSKIKFDDLRRAANTIAEKLDTVLKK